MEELLAMFSRTGEASPQLVALSLLEPLLILMGFILLVFASIKHYLKTKSIGALLIVISLIGSVLIGVVVELFAIQASSSAEIQLVLIGNAITGALFVMFAFGFRLICKQARQ